ncbi:MAG: polysaccharide export protein [Hyphomonas sp.]|uniref:polysaccharide biosynthesis/export family protein n=1 Tax=Hyphomonas sp. TaxID=87 RepID=UPI00184E0237|nr:polysaccharide biosynthesis/export family protein [Hyphomonas sp.]MBA3067992.1 polysaccharide export protein [Hyphomonas sp.]MBU4061330.1 polysaccharide export protein [Alphaproteobacteria bacterium]MBU4162583.1 polysaccharide export protein [Alphaproteobacteria bacterium]
MTAFRPLYILLLSALTLALAACGTTGGTAGAREATIDTQAQVATAYILGSADRLRVTVFGHPDLSGEFQVDGTGTISLPLIGQQKALGLSTGMLEQSITTTLANGYILNPRVSVEVINYRPFYILGEVGQPGEYPYTNGITVQNAVAAAGGFTYRANKKVVHIKSIDSDREIAYDLTPGTVVKPGDTLRIGERIF